jgi:tetratricopeptide (TPR) repeat protein
MPGKCELADFRSYRLSRRAIVVSSIAVVLGVSWPGAVATSLDEARSLHISGELDEALRAYDEVANAVELTDPASAASARNNSCVIHMNRGDHRRAVEQCREALRLRRVVDDPRRLGRTLNNLGLALQYWGEYDEAFVLFGEALSINEAIGDLESQVINQMVLEESNQLDPHRRATLTANVGVVYRNLGDPIQAVEMFERAEQTFGRLGDRAARANAFVNLGLVYHLNLGREEAAETAYRMALDLAPESGDRAEEIQALCYYGQLLLDLERWDEAASAFDSARVASVESATRSRPFAPIWIPTRSRGSGSERSARSTPPPWPRWPTWNDNGRAKASPSGLWSSCSARRRARCSKHSAKREAAAGHSMPRVSRPGSATVGSSSTSSGNDRCMPGRYTTVGCA